MQKFMLFTLLPFLMMALVACQEETPQIIDSSLPQGTFSAIQSGTLVAQNSTPTAGNVEVGTDTEGTTFLRLTPDFTTEFGTGTVTVYFSTSETLTFDPGNGNPDVQLVGVTLSGGEQFFKLSGPLSSKFSHVILWCGSAGIPFGNAPLN